MSHTSTISSVVITDINALQSAINELKQTGVNCDLLENQIPRGYSRNQKGMNERAPYVINLKDASYDVGLYRNAKDTGYEARTDFWNGSVASQLGVTDKEVTKEQAQLGKLYQLYSIHAITRQASMKGQRVTRTKGKDGKVQLQVRLAA